MLLATDPPRRQVMSGTPAIADADILRQFDDAKLSRAHWKILFISGMGFFTDAYDLFIIGVVMSLLQNEWHPSPQAVGLVSSTALLASAVGAVLFGRVADMLGRKRIYGYEVLVLAIGAVASAFSPSIGWLIAFRFILGIGIGGDYPVSSTIMSEYANRSTRGLMVTLVFTMQAVGLLIGPVLAAILLRSGLSHDYVWRILLAAGAIPAMAVFQMRRQLAETPRYLLMTGQRAELDAASQSVLGSAGKINLPRRKDRPHTDFREGFVRLLSNRRLLMRLVGASLAWFMMDFAYYGNTVSTPLVLRAISPNESLLQHVLMQLVVFAAAALPGYAVAALAMDRLGRKPIQVIGFAMMTLSFAAMALIPGIDKLVVPFLIIYGLSYFFTEFGPNATTFVYPAELFPVETRTTGYGIAAASGKIGAFAGVFLFPVLMQMHGLLGAESAAAIASVVGLAVTLGMLPETKLKSLEELSA
jgi:MFS transporter, PHS family, inorganic phosphate transporter